MGISAPTWAALVQFSAAGLVGGFCVLHWVWWRGQLRRAGAAWTLVWSAALALLFLANGLLAVLPAGEVLPFVRAQLLAAAVVLALPATRAYASGPPVRHYVIAACVLYALRAGLWVSTDLVVTHDGASPVPGPLDTVTFLVPVTLVGVYVVVAVGKARLTPVGAALLAVSSLSTAVLVLSFLVTDPSLRETLTSTWAIPLCIGLEALALHRLRRAQWEADRQNSMRDAVARISNAAWFLKDPEALLLRAREEARQVLGDPTIEGSLRNLPRGRFVTELFPDEGRSLDARERAFLMDLAQIVSAHAERTELAHQLARAAFTDSLTALPNRHALDEHLAGALDQAEVERTRVAVVYCDLDHFKQANDHHGHAWGDALLVQVADHLRSQVPAGSNVARLGGDEFVAVISRAPSDDALRELGLRLRNGFTGPGATTNAPRLTVGIAAWEPGEPRDAEALLRHADTAMLEAKRTRVGVLLFDRPLRRRVQSETRLRRALDAGIADKEFATHFQPIVDARTLEVVELEALARWSHRGTMLQPAEWLPLAEESGLIIPIGEALMASARSGYDRFQLPIAVNVAARQISEPDFLAQVGRAWGDSDWVRLTIEVTESALLADDAAATLKLEALRERGVRIALDDFGTGYSSLSRLATLPVDILKIDQSFVREIGTQRGLAVLRAIVGLAEAHELEVIAEGVEQASQLTALVELGVSRVQGNLLGRAAPGLPVRGPRPRRHGALGAH
ncbi:putative bifunctional diguanylate cyclase/phosphodiesterase [Cellulomonas chengniuliangii]|uniref:EAL domain-containing protein n=1 Tax=Cellulomonas chengniuliangii TaxID=2968084 RepID=A0ABY5L430_9CELL|nr:EAL domain-containing protein [Cellulomonas chengniuliangii]MCC2308421.1 EAL domain-containing protein [Cellulomonas chengniuliangii]MCC2317438.1 EAL domain-containing protein [Cellulomonas chengniuliangii]UUI76798.1 EAL domain-containing protein [Cellulomonas chengniuliangii]